MYILDGTLGSNAVRTTHFIFDSAASSRCIKGTIDDIFLGYGYGRGGTTNIAIVLLSGMVVVVVIESSSSSRNGYAEWVEIGLASIASGWGQSYYFAIGTTNDGDALWINTILIAFTGQCCC